MTILNPAPNTSGIAWSPPQAHGAEAAAWWSQRVVFDGTHTRRIDLAHALSSRPGMTEAQARKVLETAPPADGNTGPKPPWFWDAKIYFNNRPTTRREARAILEAHQVPAGYVAQFLNTAEEARVNELVEEHGDLIDDAEEESIMRSAQHRPERLSGDQKDRLEDIEKTRDDLQAGKTAR